MVPRPNYFILVAADVDKNRLSEPSAYTVARHRLTIGKWGLRQGTRNRVTIKPGDRIIIYAAGKREYGMHIVGEAKVASSAQPINALRSQSVDSPTKNTYVISDYYIQLTDTQLYARPVPLKPIRSTLSFVKHPESIKWANCLQNGCVRIAPKDYRRIKQLSRK